MIEVGKRYYLQILNNGLWYSEERDSPLSEQWEPINDDKIIIVTRESIPKFNVDLNIKLYVGVDFFQSPKFLRWTKKFSFEFIFDEESKLFNLLGYRENSNSISLAILLNHRFLDEVN